MTQAPAGTIYPNVEWATLRQAVCWVAFKLPPIEARFERLENYPNSAERHLGDLLGEHDEQELAIEEAKKTVAKALMQGALQAEGRKGIEEPTSVHDAESEEEIVYDDHRSFVYEGTHSQIPPTFWQPSALNWDESSVRPKRWHETGTDAGEYLAVRIRTQDLLRVLPDPSAQTVKSAGARGRRGRPPIFDEQQFWLMCVLEVAAHGMPGWKAEFHRRMDLVWRVVFGEPVPERGWFSDRYDELKKLRPTYEHGRKMLDDG